MCETDDYFDGSGEEQKEARDMHLRLDPSSALLVVKIVFNKNNKNNKSWLNQLPPKPRWERVVRYGWVACFRVLNSFLLAYKSQVFFFRLLNVWTTVGMAAFDLSLESVSSRSS